jgi:glycosyltransferase involved in cell wall biosynthesis
MGLLSDLPAVDKKGWPWDEEVSTALYDLKDTSWPKISIVTPSYNQGNFIEETIRSIILQNYPNLEYIIMDGGSSDETLDIINRYKQWITISVSEKDHGQSDALIKGFNKASGLIMNWINSDDILCKNGLFYIASTFLSDDRVDFIHGKNGVMNIDSKIFSFMPHPEDQLPIRYLCEMPYGQQACFFKREIYELCGGINREIHFSMDYELYVRMHLLNINVMQINELIGNIRIHDDTKTAQLESVMHQENGNTFLTFLKSCGGKNQKLMLDIGYKPYPVYEVRKKISNRDISKCTMMYLKKNIWYYYNIRHFRIALRMALGIIKMDITQLFNFNYLKIIKDGTISILQPGRAG